MKVVILAGGKGTRIREATEHRPKPMIEIGGRPILWHIMKLYAHQGFNDFVICLGYKGDVIRDYFLNYEARNADVTVTLGQRSVHLHDAVEEAGWNVTLSETGDETLTGGRLKRISRHVRDQEFMVTYGDGVADVNLAKLLEEHRKRGCLATVTAVHPASRFGELSIGSGVVQLFQEKPQVHEGWINGGFFVFNPTILDLITGDDDSLEAGLLARLASQNQLAVHQHDGFWQCMDTFREYQLLNDRWESGDAPWAVWRRPTAR
jgi:glucose-1-phosphate cytidylyltransferase